jgi:hypothetical protein
MAWYPKAIKKPITRHDTPMSRYRGICNHVAASEGTSLFGYFNQDGNPTSHFYVRRTGVVEQYVDTRFQAPAQLQGNPSLISIETQGGANEATANTEAWTAEQVQALAELHAWIHVTHGIPLVLMKDSKPATVGVGYHKLGVNPWRVDGGELWSKYAGKICPGTKKISQIPTIIQKAIVMAGDTQEGELSATDAQKVIDYAEQVSIQIQKHIDQVIPPAIDAAKAEIKDYTAACTTSVKDYVRQTDNEAQILNAVAALTQKVTDLTAKVDALPKA